MKTEIRIEIELDADEDVMESLRSKVSRKLDQMLDLHEMYGVHSIKVKTLAEKWSGKHECFLDDRQKENTGAEIVSQQYYNEKLKKYVPEFGIRVLNEDGVWWYPYTEEHKMFKAVIKSILIPKQREKDIDSFIEFLKGLKRK